ncbi:hypothetical protein EJF36_10725 [Bacillus sp. HMF5848]|uniref:hypothetical protein n=1 Tax=Bacillus sp. HMF5848 TaxID=2495421 RepID=UPI000F792437|nr:hypothetical protein [Bacillus sp. HMF5848]RSK27319.1 hypothetical protein EJF36_10725 [Bacillus sp. HMF5848]
MTNRQDNEENVAANQKMTELLEDKNVQTTSKHDITTANIKLNESFYKGNSAKEIPTYVYEFNNTFNAELSDQNKNRLK